MDETLFEQYSQPRVMRRTMGKRLRKEVPRSSHGTWEPATDRRDPIAVLQAQDAGRIERLLPIKYGRMAASPFAFLRGSAAVMAADLAHTPVSGQQVILCGDAHISNFGLFASPERRLVFDVNDFDECYPGPWEWDLKRLAASVVVGGRENGFDDPTNHELAALAGKTYRQAMRRFARLPTLNTWYFNIDAREVQELFRSKASKHAQKESRSMIKSALARTQERTMKKLTTFEDGRRRIISVPPLLVPLRELDLASELAGQLADEPLEQLTEQFVKQLWQDYLHSLATERRYLLERFKIIDVALRVGGVGSVGTRCLIVLLQGGGQDEGLILQMKEVGPSALAAYLPAYPIEQQAERVITGQRLMQAASDPFLGWHQSRLTKRAYYWRQLKDMKGSYDVAALDLSGFATYVAVCAATLARAHARTGDPAIIAGYLGKNESFDKAIADFAVAYAEQTEKDFLALKKAIIHGRIEAQEGI